MKVGKFAYRLLPTLPVPSPQYVHSIRFPSSSGCHLNEESIALTALGLPPIRLYCLFVWTIDAPSSGGYGFFRVRTDEGTRGHPRIGGRDPWRFYYVTALQALLVSAVTIIIQMQVALFAPWACFEPDHTSACMAFFCGESDSHCSELGFGLQDNSASRRGRDPRTVKPCGVSTTSSSISV